MSDLIRVDPGRVTTITLNRPDRGNALSAEMLQLMFDALGTASANGDARVVVLRGEGKHFCAGADVSDVSASASSGIRYGVGFEQLLRTIEEVPVPVVARVQGAALGAGCQLLAACDLSVASEGAQIGIPAARLGLVLDLEKTQRLVRVIGVTRTRELMLTARSITGKEAAAWGLVTKACKDRELDYYTDEMVEKVADGAPLSVRGSKAAMRAILDHGALSRNEHPEIFAAHDAAGAEALASEDMREGMAALRERRPPEFKGR